MHEEYTFEIAIEIPIEIPIEIHSGHEPVYDRGSGQCGARVTAGFTHDCCRAER
jgi:hypothetical protein